MKGLETKCTVAVLKHHDVWTAQIRKYSKFGYLGNSTGMAFWAKLLFKQFLQCIRHKYVVLSWHICLFISSFFFSSDTQVVMVSIGNTYHYSWNIYGQSTVGRIFLDSIVNRSYSVFFLLLIILFSFISFSYFDGEEVGLWKTMKIYQNTKRPPFFFDFWKPLS